MKAIALVILAAVLSSGCATALMTQMHNGKVEKAAVLRAQPLMDGRVGAQVGVEMYSVKGVGGLFKEEPGWGALAVGLDLAAIVGAFAIYENMRDSEDVITEERPTTSQESGGDSVAIYGDNNQVNINKAAE